MSYIMHNISGVCNKTLCILLILRRNLKVCFYSTRKYSNRIPKRHNLDQIVNLNHFKWCTLWKCLRNRNAHVITGIKSVLKVKWSLFLRKVITLPSKFRKSILDTPHLLPYATIYIYTRESIHNMCGLPSCKLSYVWQFTATK